MKIEKVNYDFSTIVMPTLAEAKEITSKFNNLYNDCILILVPRAANKTATGTFIGDIVQEKVQTAIDHEGMLVVTMSESAKVSFPIEGLEEGMFVWLDPSCPTVGTIKVTNPKTGYDYNAIICKSYAIISNITPPNYEVETEEVVTKKK
jgi:hypothetical protein